MSETQASYAPRLPEAVRRASLRADELAREAGILNVPPLEEPAPQPVEPPAVPAEEQPPLPGFEPAPAQQVVTPATPDTWEQRYNTLQGKYNSEIPELRGQLRAMQEMITSLQSRAAPEPQPQPTRETTFALPKRDVPQEDVDAYGQDLVQATQRWASIAVEPEIATLRHRIAQLEGTTQQHANMTVVQRTEAGLDRALPEWRTLNNDTNFIAWLHQVDPFSGRTRKSLADEAYGAGDIARTLAFFQAYTNEHTAVSQSPGTQPVHTNGLADRLPLANLAVPGRGATAAPPTPGAPQRRIWTSADISAFYRQRQRGQWAGREAEADRLEADIFAAGHEGRIRQ
jgi:hypothetical protein